MMNLDHQTLSWRRLISMLSVLLLVSACSKNKQLNNELSHLENNFKQHKNSSYVNANLKPISYAKTKTQARNKKINQRLIKHERNKLANRKKQASARLNGVINHNGLYTPSATQLRLSADNKSQQRRLKNTASLDNVLAIALRNNLNIRSALDDTTASLARYDQVSFLNDSLAQYATFTTDLTLTSSNQKQKNNSAKSYPSPGLSALKTTIIDQTVEAKRLALKQTTQDVITQVRIAYFELQFIQQEISLANKNNKLLKVLKTQVKDSYSTYDTNNKIDLATILDVDIQINKNQNILQIAKQKQRAQYARLNSLLNLRSGFSFGRFDPLKRMTIKSSAQDLIKKATHHRVEIALLETQLKKLEYIIQLSQKRFYPDLNAGFSRFQSRGSKQQFTTKPKIKINNFFAKDDAYLSETKLKHKALKSKINALKVNTENAIQQALSVYKTQQQSHVLYQSKIIPKAKATLEIAKTLYETGETSYLDVIESEEKILNYQLLTLKAVKDINVSWAKLVRLIGN